MATNSWPIEDYNNSQDIGDEISDELRLVSLPILLSRRNLGLPEFSAQDFRRRAMLSRFTGRKSSVYYPEGRTGNFQIKLASAFPKMGVIVAAIKNVLRLYRLCHKSDSKEKWFIEPLGAYELQQTRIEEVSSSYFVFNNFMCFSMIENSMNNGIINICTHSLDPSSNLPDGWIERIHMNPSRAIWACECSPTSPLIVVGGYRVISLYVLGQNRLTTRSIKNCVSSLCFSSDGQIIYGGSRNNQLWMYDQREPQPVNVLQLKKGIGCIKILKDDRSMIASTFDDGLFHVDLRMKRKILTYLGHNNQFLKIPFSFDETSGILCSAGQDRYLRFWDLFYGHSVYYLVPDDANSEYVPNAHYSDQWKCQDSQRQMQGVIASDGSCLSVIQL